MLEIIIDTLIDSIKMLPFLLISYVIIEYIEHRTSKKVQHWLANSGKFGSFIGALLGCIPQCGFSVTASNLYAGRIITLGTLLAVFVSTSDEAIPVLLSHPGSIGIILKLLLVKVILAFLLGFFIDHLLGVFKKKKSEKEQIEDNKHHIEQICEHCDCEHGIFKSALKHTLNIFIYIIIVSFIFNIIIHLIGEDNLTRVLLTGNILQPFVAAFIGLIPSCASSIILTELYLAGSLSFGSIIAGLSTGAGIGLVVLFKANKNIKENLKILFTLYLFGVIAGIILTLFGM